MENVSNEGLGIMLGNLTEKFDCFSEKNDAAHEELKEHVMATNGRVSSLERWRDMTIGAIVILNILVIPVAVSFITKYLRHE